MAKTSRVLTLLLRLLAVCSTLSAAIVMATSHQRASFFAVSFEAKYTHTPAFKYFLIANIIGSIYSFLALFVPPQRLLWHIVFALDVVITMLLTSSVSAAVAIAYVGKKGNTHAGWLPICGQVHRYCDLVAGALAAGFIGVIIYVVLLYNSVHTLLKSLPG